jgi:tetratricopeptide (TPR) repeat protein
MKCQLRQYNESLIVYREAVDILNDIRKQQQATKPNPHDSEIDVTTNDYHKTMMNHHQQGIMITHQIAYTLYLQGKVYHRQYKFIEAFHYYNKSLNLLFKIKKKKKKLLNKLTACSVTKTQQKNTTTCDFGIKTITKCMKSKYAFEKLISAYWGDNHVI